MGKYTVYDIPGVDLFIDTQLTILKEICLSELGDNLISIVLGGSFGRGEGSVLISPDSRIEPMRDYDIRLIVNNRIPREAIERIHSDFLSAIGMQTAAERFSGETGFSLTLEPIIRSQLVTRFLRDRDIRAYDHLYASQVIYGIDCSKDYQISPREIPEINGLRLLYQKMVGLVGHYPSITANSNIRQTLLYECDKTFIEICTALFLLTDEYVPSYRLRADLFREKWRIWFPALAELLPDLDMDIVRATDAKLRPSLDLERVPESTFQRARAALLIVHRFFIRMIFDFDADPDKRGLAGMQKILHRTYFRVPVEEWLRIRNLDNYVLRKACNIGFHYFLRYRYARSNHQPLINAVLDTLHHYQAPILTIYLASWILLESLEEGSRKASRPLIEELLSTIPGNRPKRAKSTIEKPYYLHDRILEMYHDVEQSSA